MPLCHLYTSHPAQRHTITDKNSGDQAPSDRAGEANSAAAATVSHLCLFVFLYFFWVCLQFYSGFFSSVSSAELLLQILLLLLCYSVIDTAPHTGLAYVLQWLELYSSAPFKCWLSVNALYLEATVDVSYRIVSHRLVTYCIVSCRCRVNGPNDSYSPGVCGGEGCCSSQRHSFLHVTFDMRTSGFITWLMIKVQFVFPWEENVWFRLQLLPSPRP